MGCLFFALCGDLAFFVLSRFFSLWGNLAFLVLFRFSAVIFGFACLLGAGVLVAGTSCDLMETAHGCFFPVRCSNSFLGTR